MSDGAEFVVETRGLRKTFESEGAPVRALRGVDFTMTPGEFVAVMGPSGCGKSTLLRVLNRIYELYPNQKAVGKVLLDGNNILSGGIDLNLLRFAEGVNVVEQWIEFVYGRN